MKIFWIWLIWSIGSVVDVTIITWNFPVKQGRKLLEMFYGIILPLTAGWKLYLVWQGRSTDIILLFLLVFLLWGTWKITGATPGEVLIAFAFLYIGGAGSELASVGILQSILGMPVVPFAEAEGSMLCVMLANIFMLFYLMMENWLWKRYGQEKLVNRDLLLFFFVLVQTVFLFWIVYAGYQKIISINFILLVAAAIIVFGTMSFSFVEIYDEETREREEKLKKIELESQKEYERYRELKEMEKMLHHIRHDFNNQLATVYYLLKEGKTEQAEKILDDIERELEDKEGQEESPEEIVKESKRFVLEEEEGVFPDPGKQIILIPVGQMLLFPTMLRILAAHWGSWVLLIDAGVLLFTVGTDGLWLFLLFNQGRREKRNKELFAAICRQQVELNRKNVVLEGIQERKALKEELLFSLKRARAAVEVSKEPSVFGSYLIHEQKKEELKLCNNELVNTVLEEKQKDCQNLHISFSAKVEIPERVEIKSSHLCSIFTNLLDNGIHACQSLPEAKRWILIQSKQQGDYLYLRISNATSEEYMNRPVRPGHGLGRQIIAGLAEKYQGEYWTKISGETYIAAVVLQICGIAKMTSN